MAYLDYIDGITLTTQMAYLDYIDGVTLTVQMAYLDYIDGSVLHGASDLLQRHQLRTKTRDVTQPRVDLEKNAGNVKIYDRNGKYERATNWLLVTSGT